jgi:hypothetical protein
MGIAIEKGKYPERRFIMIKKRRTIPILDIYQASFLANHEIGPVLCKQGSQFIFKFPGTEEVLKLLEEYNQNPYINKSIGDCLWKWE